MVSEKEKLEKEQKKVANLIATNQENIDRKKRSLLQEVDLEQLAKISRKQLDIHYQKIK